jgi:tetratricopeptide (TPR) repeat protein
LKSAEPIEPASRCIACREVTQPHARICPHCGSSQMPQRWKFIGSLLKWVGAVTAIVSLIIGVDRLGGILTEWRERSVAVQQYVAAARIQSEMGDFPGAWSLIEQALSITPASESALAGQTNVAMAWLRDFKRPQGGLTYSDIIDPLMLTLYRGAVDADISKAADAMAHIGWANYLRRLDDRRELEVDAYFQRALEMDPANIYAHVYWACWLLHDSNTNSYGQDRVVMAEGHFGAALKTGRQRPFVVENRFIALARTPLPGGDVAAIAAADAMRRENGTLPLSERIEVLERFRTVFRTQFAQGQFLQRLLQQLPAEDVLATYRWLSQGVDFSNEQTRPFGMTPHQHRFMLAILTEAAGNPATALEQYRELESQLSDSDDLKRRLGAALDRAAAAADRPQSAD